LGKVLLTFSFYIYINSGYNFILKNKTNYLLDMVGGGQEIKLLEKWFSLMGISFLVTEKEGSSMIILIFCIETNYQKKINSSSYRKKLFIIKDFNRNLKV